MFVKSETIIISGQKFCNGSWNGRVWHMARDTGMNLRCVLLGGVGPFTINRSIFRLTRFHKKYQWLQLCDLQFVRHTIKTHHQRELCVLDSPEMSFVFFFIMKARHKRSIQAAADEDLCGLLFLFSYNQHPCGMTDVHDMTAELTELAGLLDKLYELCCVEGSINASIATKNGDYNCGSFEYPLSKHWVVHNPRSFYDLQSSERIIQPHVFGECLLSLRLSDVYIRRDMSAPSSHERGDAGACPRYCSLAGLQITGSHLQAEEVKDDPAIYLE
ncbi:hypothetical protein KSP39_PZI010561 [Platanthera zijinensis]|uniref:Uncharacterized protein n=1 Tax=Platanthera zijinensis TaxID=2320716 RepID=A0AAP0BHZ9_9ASPA